MTRDSSFSHSFMCLSFVAAALLVLTQLRSGSSDSAVATIAASPGSPHPSSAPASSPVPSPQPQVTTAPAAGAASAEQAPHPGIALALQTALNPSTLVEQSGVVVDLSDRQVRLYKNWALQATYAIAIGREGWETPTGKFSVTNMQIDPVWRQPFTGEIVPSGPGNPLGSRWIGIWSDGEHEIGLHGTNEEDLIGQAVSHGCIRLREADIQALYDQISVGTPVEIRP